MSKNTENIEFHVIDYLKELSGEYGAEARTIKKFNSKDEELNSLLNGVALHYLSRKHIFELKGKDTLDFLNRIATNSLKDLQKGQLQRTFFTTEKGRIIDLTTVVNFEDYNLLICNAENKDKIYRWISRYIIADDVTITDSDQKYSLIELLGPQAHSFITLIGGNEIGEMQGNQLKVINTEGMIFFILKLFEQNGDLKYWMISDQSTGKQLIEYLMENKGPFNFNLVGEDAYNLYRIKKGFPSAPQEINDNYNPHELGLLEFVNFKKGCYIGQEIIARLDTYQKVQQQLKCISINSDVNIQLPTKLFDNSDAEAGELTSLSYCEHDKKSFGLALIRRSFLENKELHLNLNSGEKIKVSIHNLPFKK